MSPITEKSWNLNARAVFGCVCVDSVVVTSTAQNVSSHASELLSQEGHVCLDDVHPLSNSHSGLKQIRQRDYELECLMNKMLQD